MKLYRKGRKWHVEYLGYHYVGYIDEAFGMVKAIKEGRHGKSKS